MNLIVDQLEENDLLATSILILRSFNYSVAATLNDEGIKTFKKGLSVKALTKRLHSGNLFLIYRNEKEIVGVGEVRDKNHLNLLFVEPSLQKKALVEKYLVS